MKRIPDFLPGPSLRCQLLIAMVTWGMAVSAASAIDMDFSGGQGYSNNGGDGGTGNLSEQPSEGDVRWRGHKNSSWEPFRVVQDSHLPDGSVGQVVRSFPPTDPTVDGASPIYIFQPGTSELGGTFDAAQSRMAYSFWFRFDDAPGGKGAIFRPRFGNGSAGGTVTEFEIEADGVFLVARGQRAKTSKDGTLDFVAAKGQWVRVEGVLDYKEKTFTVSVNGVFQAIDGKARLPFASQQADVLTPDFSLRVFSGQKNDFHPISISKIHLELLH